MFWKSFKQMNKFIHLFVYLHSFSIFLRYQDHCAIFISTDNWMWKTLFLLMIISFRKFSVCASYIYALSHSFHQYTDSCGKWNLNPVSFKYIIFKLIIFIIIFIPFVFLYNFKIKCQTIENFVF